MSCVSIENIPAPVEELEEVFIDDLENLLSNGRYSRTLQSIDYLRRERGLISPDILRLEEKTVAEMQAELTNNLDVGDFQSAYTLRLSLDAMEIVDESSEWSSARIARSLADEWKNGEESVAALSLLLQLYTRGLLDEDAKNDLLALAYHTKNPFVIEQLIEEFEERNLPVSQVYKQSTKMPSTADMLPGTATVWVDKGIRIEGGIGYPDRVMGSGFFIDPRGYLLTNYHVIQSEVDPEYEGYSRLYIRLPGKPDEKIPASVHGWDRIFDLALIKVELEPAYVFPIAGEVSVDPGETVFVIGSPLDPFLENTITSGIISATSRRKMLQMGDVIQLDAPVNPGNSGGPLLNTKGSLVGIVFAGFQPFEGLNFAIPMKWVLKSIPYLFLGGELEHGWLGMSLFENEGQLRVTYTVPGEPAHEGGIRAGDVIVSMNGHRLSTIQDFQELLLDLPVDTLTRIAWTREGSDKVGLFSVSKRPFSPMEQALERDSIKNVLVPLFGMKLKEAGNFLWETNYVVEEVIRGSIADNTGISVNDPLNVQAWEVIEDDRIVVLQVFIRKKEAGFLESVIKLVAYLESDSFV